MEIHSLLTELGFGDYEARAYVGLVGIKECNGYEVAKATGVPRANIYAVLERLVERGAAQRIETLQGVRYAATPPQVLLANIERRHQGTLASAQEALAELAEPQDAAQAFTLRGRAEVMERARADIESASKTLLVAIQPPEATQLAEPLRHARERGVTITTLCLEACEQECGGCQGDIHRVQLAPEGASRWLLLVVDQRTALLGQMAAASAEGLVTTRHIVVELASAYIRQSLTLALLGDELGSHFKGLLSTQTLQLLQRLNPGGNFAAHHSNRDDIASS